jgi:hypothetical protein
MTTTVTRSRVVAPALAAVLALSCGRSLTLDDRPGSGTGGAGGSSRATTDGGDAASQGGASGGAGGAAGAGGKIVQPTDAGAGGTTNKDAGNDVIDAKPPLDLAPEHIQMPDVGGGCPVDCTKLPHVRAGGFFTCTNGVCGFNSYTSCDAGFFHCSSAPNVGCETDLSMSPNCGSCGVTCYAGSSCQTVNGYNYCLQDCQAPMLDRCDFSCIDLQSDPTNCGACNTNCYVNNTQVACQQGKCVTLACTDSTVADCTSDLGCETSLGSDLNCGGCNDPACTLTNTMYTCSDSLGCKASVCSVGFANCNTTSPDCETAVASPGATATCLPQYVSSVGLATQLMDNTVAAIASDGSFFIASVYQGAVDFDPSSTGKDVRTANDPDGFVTKFNADGSYAWTATLGGRGTLTMKALAPTPQGGVVASGIYQDTIDLDPSAAQDIHITSDPFLTDTFVVELAGNGAEVWGRTFAGTSGANDISTGVAVDAAGAVYVAGMFSGTVDFDPGAGSASHTPPVDSSGFVVKLDSAGNFAWAQAFDDPDCTTFLAAVTVATDGSVWAAGSLAAGPTCALGPERASYPIDDVLIVKLNSAGTTRSVWTVGESDTDDGFAIAAGRNGGVYVGGMAADDADMDPGPGVARRWFGAYSQSGFVLALAADGTYQWSRVLNGAQLAVMASAPDGGVILTGSSNQAFVTRLTPNGDSVWTMPIGDGSIAVNSLTSTGTSFAVTGNFGGTQDLDPGPSIDLLFGDVSFVSRFKF